MYDQGFALVFAFKGSTISPTFMITPLLLHLTSLSAHVSSFVYTQLFALWCRSGHPPAEVFSEKPTVFILPCPAPSPPTCPNFTYSSEYPQSWEMITYLKHPASMSVQFKSLSVYGVTTTCEAQGNICEGPFQCL